MSLLLSIAAYYLTTVMPMSKSSFGVCRLTGRSGKFVKCHILPRSLTLPEEPGLYFIQGGKGQRPIKRWTSWYDPHLIIRKGEDVFEALDTWAIQALRKHQLIWSGWNEADVLPEKHEVFGSEQWGFREVQGIDADRLRMFLLSLLWRAAASNLAEMSEIVIPKKDLDFLGSLLRSERPVPLSFYPAQLIQLSTRGRMHNLTPIRTTKIIPAFGDDSLELTIPIFRFYFDGLIVHFQIQAQDDGYTERLGRLVVGTADSIPITTVPYETSFQRSNLENLISESETNFANVLNKL